MKLLYVFLLIVLVPVNVLAENTKYHNVSSIRLYDGPIAFIPNSSVMEKDLTKHGLKHPDSNGKQKKLQYRIQKLTISLMRHPKKQA